MKNPFAFIGVVLLVACGSKVSLAQVGTATYTFKNRAEVRAAVLRNLHNLRASYNVITCAGRQGMMRTVLQTYEQQLTNHRFDAPADVSSSYALVHQFFVWRDLNWKEDTDQSIHVRDVGGLLQVQWFREKAVKEKPKAPEVLLGDAIFQCYQVTGRPLALREMKEVILRTPKWADAHYWYAWVLNNYAISPPIQKQKTVQTRSAQIMLRELNRAQKLDPGLLPRAYIDYQYAYILLNKPKEALSAFDAFAQGMPNFGVSFDKTFGRGSFATWRQSLVTKAQRTSD